MGAAVGIQCLCLNDWSEHDHAVWGSRRLCDLARSVDRLAPRSVAVRSPLLGKAGFCERCFMPSLSDFSSVSLIFCYFCFILPRFSSLSWAHHPLLSRFRLLTRRLALQQARCAIRGSFSEYHSVPSSEEAQLHRKDGLEFYDFRFDLSGDGIW